MRDNDFDRIRDWDAAHVLHPWQGMSGGAPGRTFAEAGSGIEIVTEDGRRLIDGPGGMWCVQLGHGVAEIAEAMAGQARRMAYVSPFHAANAAPAKLAAQIADRSPGDLNTVFFTTGGSTAVDSAIRFLHFRNNVLGRPEKKLIISRDKAYHGSTYLAASVSGKERDRTWFDKADDLAFFLPDVNPYRRAPGQTLEAFLDRKVADLEDAILFLGPEKVAGFIAEPILASGGVIVPPEGYHRRTKEICERYDVAYISDEVVTGFGRLGHWFASESVFGIAPDIITCAKGLTSGYAPMGAVLISDALMADVAGRDVTFSNGFTYSGHPVSAAAGLKTIEIFERDGVLAHVRAVAPLFQERLRALGDLPLVGDARGMGLVGCIECVMDAGEGDALALDREVGARIDAHAQSLGLMVRPNVNMCVFSPPLIISAGEIERMFDILQVAVKRTEDDLIRDGLWRGAAR